MEVVCLRAAEDLLLLMVPLTHRSTCLLGKLQTRCRQDIGTATDLTPLHSELKAHIQRKGGTASSSQTRAMPPLVPVPLLCVSV